MPWPELLLLVTAAAVSAAMTWGLLRHAGAHELMDVPNNRSSHERPTPRGGGLAIVVTVGVAAACAATTATLPRAVLTVLVLGGALVAAVGYADDRRGLPALPRFLVHAAAALAAVIVLGGAVPVFPRLPAAVEFALLVVGIVWSTNLFNFMDGIDGIAASQATFVAAASAALVAASGGAPTPWLILPLATAGACVGFLAWNWPPARIFMGDVGSGFLGYWLAAVALALHGAGLLGLWTSVTLGSAFIADATMTLLRRAIRRERWHEAHRSHAYQHLARRWRSHAKVTSLLCGLDLVVVLPLAWASVRSPALAPAIAAASLGGFALLALLAGAGRREARRTD